MNVLLIASRELGGRRSGRKAVLHTIVESMLDLRHQVDVVVVSRAGHDAPPVGLPPDARVRVHHVEAPGLVRVATNVATRASTRRLSLNESLYASGRVRRAVRAIAERYGSEVVIADMIRTYPLAEATGLPMVVDLDDLLSDRYRNMAGNRRAAEEILGYYGERLPRPLAATLGWCAARASRWEAAMLERREVAAALGAAAVSLVSGEEARRLSARVGLPVASLPMSVHPPPVPVDPRLAPSHALVFVGGLDYGPNLQSLRWFTRSVLPELGPGADGPFTLTVVGHCPDRVRAELESPQVRFRGYVADLDAEMARHRAFVAPIVSGSGVKTKVVEAMASGLPVVTTDKGVTGTGARDGEHCLVAADASEFAACIRKLAENPELSAALGGAGRRLVVQHFSDTMIADSWHRVLRSVA